MDFILEHRNMYWSVEPLKPPKATKVVVDTPPIENPSKPPDKPLTEWIAEPSSDSIPEAGIHYVVRTKALANDNEAAPHAVAAAADAFSGAAHRRGPTAKKKQPAS